MQKQMQTAWAHNAVATPAKGSTDMNNDHVVLDKDVAELLAGRIYKRMERVQQGDRSALPIVTPDERQLPEAGRAEQMAREKFKGVMFVHDDQHMGASWSVIDRHQRVGMLREVYQAAVHLKAELGKCDNNAAHDYSAHDAATDAFAIWYAVKERAFLL